MRKTWIHLTPIQKLKKNKLCISAIAPKTLNPSGIDPSSWQSCMADAWNPPLSQPASSRNDPNSRYCSVSSYWTYKSRSRGSIAWSPISCNDAHRQLSLVIGDTDRLPWEHGSGILGFHHLADMIEMLAEIGMWLAFRDSHNISSKTTDSVRYLEE